MKTIYGIKENDSKGEFQKAYFPNNLPAKQTKQTVSLDPGRCGVTPSCTKWKGIHFQLFSPGLFPFRDDFV